MNEDLSRSLTEDDLAMSVNDVYLTEPPAEEREGLWVRKPLTVFHSFAAIVRRISKIICVGNVRGLRTTFYTPTIHLYFFFSPKTPYGEKKGISNK